MRKFIPCLVALAMWSSNILAANPAPDFSLPTDRDKVSLSSLKGQVVYVDFWASWCGPCRKSFPYMNQLMREFGKQGFTIVAVNLDTDRSLSKKFLERYPANFTLAYDPSGDVATRYDVQGMPSSYLIDRDGHLRSSHIGFRKNDKYKIESDIHHLLQENQSKLLDF